MSEQMNEKSQQPISSPLPEWMTDQPVESQSKKTESNDGAPGSLRGDVQVELHTREVYRLLTGLDPRTKERTKSARASLFSFEKSCQSIEFAVQNDDPYADYYFYQLHQRINETHAALKAEIEQFSKWLRGKIPASISYSESTSQNPTILQVRAKTKLFYLGLYLALDVDVYCRMIYLACHFALIRKSTQNQLIYDKLRAVRSITEEANKYRHTDATRDDFAANNARARAAIEKHGFTLGEEFLKGELRSTLAPDIINRPENDEQGKAAVESDIKQITDDPLLQVSHDNEPTNTGDKEAHEQAIDTEGRSETTETVTSSATQ